MIATVEAVSEQAAKQLQSEGLNHRGLLELNEQTMWQNIHSNLGKENVEAMEQALHTLVANTDFIQR